jgi:predicted ATP-grasp superfamily ATP-dependent carboligase
VSNGVPVPAVVVGGIDNGGGLGLVRSLGRAGVPVIIVDQDASAPALHSRYARKHVVSDLAGRALVRELLTLQASLNARPVLFLTSEEAVLTVSQYRDELGAAYRLRLPDHDGLRSLLQKSSFQELAEARGFPVPRSVRITNALEIASLAQLTFPAVIKPSVKTGDYLMSRFARGYRAATIGEAEAQCRRILPVLPNLVVQEWIEGADSDLYFCLQYRGSNGTVSSFTGRKLSIWPPDIGTTASCTAAAPEAHETLTQMTDAFFDAVSFVGMGSMEYKRDARTGRFFMIEPTVGRVDWQEEVATLHGVNIPLAAYRYEIDAELPPEPEAIVPVIWRDSARHWKAMRRARGGIVAQPNAKVIDAYWRLDDPLPALFHVLSTVIRIVRRTVKRLEPWLPSKAF